MYADETAYMPVSLIRNVVLPIFEVASNFLVMTSTLYTHWNFFTRLLDIAEREEAKGNHIINWFRQSLVCDRCMERGEKAQLKCRHNMHMIPRWKSSKKLEIARYLHEEGDQESLKRESLGFLGDSKDRVFSPDDVQRLDAAPLVRPTPMTPAKVVFVAMDPNSGGPNNMGLAAVARYGDRTLVCLLHLLLLLHGAGVGDVRRRKVPRAHQVHFDAGGALGVHGGADVPVVVLPGVDA